MQFCFYSDDCACFVLMRSKFSESAPLAPTWEQGLGVRGDTSLLNQLPKHSAGCGLGTLAQTSSRLLAPSPHEGFSSLHPLPALRGELNSTKCFEGRDCPHYIRESSIVSMLSNPFDERRDDFSWLGVRPGVNA